MKRRIFNVLFALVLLLSMSLVTAVPAAAANTWTVDDDGVEYPGADYTTIQSAINAATPGDTINVYPGTYDPQIEVTPPGWGGHYYAQGIVVWKNDLTIQAVDPDPANTIVESTLYSWMDAWRIQRLTGGEWTGSGSTQTGGFNPGTSASPSAMMIVASDVTVSGFTFHRHYDYTSATFNTAGVMIGGIAPGDPINLGANGNTVENCVFSDVWHAVYIWHSSGNQILDNTVEALTTDHWAAIEAYDGYNDAQVNLGYLSQDNTISGNSLANKGIGFGAWAPLTLKTDNSGTTITGNTLHGYIRFYYSESSEVEISGNAINGGVNIEGTGGLTSSSITGNTISNTGNGILLQNSSGVTIDDNVITNNSWAGIIVENSDGNTVDDNTVSSGVAGIRVINGSSSNEIMDNTVDNQVVGIYFESSGTGNVANNNHITLSSWAGIQLLNGSEDNDLTNNSLSSDERGIEIISSDDNTIEGNVLDLNAVANIHVSDSSGTNINNNTITNSAQGIVVDTSAPDTAANYNNIVDNGVGLANYTTDIIDAVNNWWGDVSGPYHWITNTDGLGNAVSDNVIFDPWITELVYTGGPQPVNLPINLEATLYDSDGATAGAGASIFFYLNATYVGSAVTDVNGMATLSLDPMSVGIYDVSAALGPECIPVDSLLAVYDPNAGFVTGGGWIDSPAGAYMPGPAGTVVVTPANVNVDWFTNDTRYDGYVAFVEGPQTPPLGTGSLEMGSTASQDKAQLFNYDYMGTRLADIDSITYSTYRDGGSTNPPAQYPAINIEVDFIGDGTSYTTLVWEPIYAYGQSNLAVDTWQTWDAMAPSQTGFAGGWWSTKDIPGVCAFNCFVDWDTIVQNNPNAKIKYGVGVNIGSGWNGNFIGAVDALSLKIDGQTNTYDFESILPLTGKATFGFVAKYKKGANSPEGQTEFVFKAAGLNFHSTSYEWLVVTGSDFAKFKGTGTINGEGEYKFQIWAGDDDPDTFRIKIWYEVDNTEIVVYDNGMNQAIGGGNIVVHTSKK